MVISRLVSKCAMHDRANVSGIKHDTEDIVLGRGEEVRDCTAMQWDARPCIPPFSLLRLRHLFNNLEKQQYVKRLCDLELQRVKHQLIIYHPPWFFEPLYPESVSEDKPVFYEDGNKDEGELSGDHAWITKALNKGVVQECQPWCDVLGVLP
ncbi:hypothetical protein L1987_30103 [Smallanthus sonchifolius]|uniref:Uncharacterized protein n=1 Tax=Smallanthus sonchifolius TaxID=185202 RepID=A0ACB9I1A1_9ASTR|nr:hypothetical protein L1987_30103 [Smallanthus sonchifolius]